MNLDWTTILVALLGSNLALDIWKTIKEGIQKKKKINIESELSTIKDMIQKLDITFEAKYKEINERLDNHEKRFAAINHRLDVFEKELSDIKEVINQNAKGTILGLENDAVIFKALRDHEINGNSEAQEAKMNEYYAKCAERSYKID